MSFFQTLFGRTPAAFVARGRRALESGDWAEARHHLDEALARGKGDTALAAEVKPLLARARAELVSVNKAYAEECAGAGEWQQALESLDVCIELCDDPQRRAAFEDKRHRWTLKADSGAPARGERIARSAPAGGVLGGIAGSAPGVAGPDGEADEDTGAGDSEDVDRFELYLASLTPQAVELFEGEDERFRKAWLLLEDGDGAGAVKGFTPLVAERPTDALLLFQRGRARLLVGDLGGAIDDLKKVREAWGFAALDLSGHLHVGIMLAEAYIGLGRLPDADEVLRAAAEERQDDFDVWAVLGRVRILREEWDGAFEAAERLGTLQPRRIEGYLLAAEVRRAKGEAQTAIDLLERGLSTCCGTGGSCQVKPLEVPAARLLAELYLDAGRRPDRVDSLLLQIQAAQDGQSSWHDHFLRARYHKLVGDVLAMGEARKRALDSIPPARARERALLEQLLATHL